MLGRNLKIFEFTQIKHVNESDVIRDITLVDHDVNQPEILHILNESALNSIYIF